MDIQNIKTISLILVFFLSLSLISALGVSAPYWDNNPLKMYPGEEKEVSFILVNRPDAETSKATIHLLNDGGIAEITSGTSYNVKPGTGEDVIFRINLPENDIIGNSYNIEFEVLSTPEGEGQVAVAVGYNVQFPVEVVEEQQVPVDQIPDEAMPQVKESNGMIFGIVVVILIIVLIILFLILRRKK
ncbi:MAG: hypothetical protein ABIB79_03705 [archaeon]